jgi:monoterpene epsilon-lactone hydrolase
MPSLRSRFCRIFIKHLIGSKFITGLSIDQMRKGMEGATRMAFLPAKTKVEQTSCDGVSAEWVCAKNVNEKNVVLFLHGGGYNTGSPSTHRELAAHISKASSAKVLLPDYRLAPENPFPAALEDATTSYRWLIESSYSSSKIAIAGDSAGGGLTLVTCISIRDTSDPIPSSLACISPWADLEMTGKSVKTLASMDPMVSLASTQIMASIQIMASNYIGSNDPRSPLISPVHADLKDFPPMIIQVGSDEILLDDSRRMAERAKQAGVDLTINIYEGMWHVFHIFYRLMPEAKYAVHELGSFIKNHFRR